MKREIRVVQYGVGPIGARIVRLMLEKPMLEVVGAIDVDPAKAGKDLGEVIEAGRKLDVVVSADAQSVLQGGVDVVLHCTSSSLEGVADQLTECMEAGAHVVSTCEELAYPFRRFPELSERLDECARKNNVALLGTGVNPGFAMDKIVLTLAAAATRVDSARAIRIVDASKRRLPLQKKIGAGMSEEEFRQQVAAGVIKHHGLPESVAMVAEGLGLPVDEIGEIIQPVVATERIKTEFLEVEPGQVAGVHQIARGLSKGEEKIYLELQMYVGAKEPADTVELMGEPPLTLTVPGGIHGLRTSRDMPMSYFSGLDVEELRSHTVGAQARG
jgi:4-hydroxy-tetrahydrodipicolinate reductase